MNRLKLAIVLGFAIMFVAGLAVGRARQPAVVPTRSDEHFPNFSRQLGLSPSQDQQMDRIWHEARAKADALQHQFRDYDRQRDEAVMALLTPEQKPMYEQIQKEHDARVSALHAEISKIMKEAGKNVRLLLTPEQAKAFDELRKTHDHHRGPPPPDGGHYHYHQDPDTNPSPATAPTP